MAVAERFKQESMYGLSAQGPEEMCLSLEHQNPSKTSEKMGYFDRVTVSLHIIRISFLLLGTSCLGRPPGDGLRSPFGRSAVRQQGYGLRLLIFKSRSGSDKKRRNRLQ